MVLCLLHESSFLESAACRPSAGSQLSLPARHAAPTYPLVCQVSRHSGDVSALLAQVQCRIPYSVRVGTFPIQTLDSQIHLLVALVGLSSIVFMVEAASILNPGKSIPRGCTRNVNDPPDIHTG